MDSHFDLVISKGTIVDGTGRPRFPADIGLRDGRIAALSLAGTLRGAETIDAAGRVVAPGFIDIHSHADWVLPLPDHAEILAPLVRQGVTTVVAGNCGISPAPVTDRSVTLAEGSSEMLRDRGLSYSWRSMGQLFDHLEDNGLLLNAAFLVGHGTLRQAVMGNRPGVPDANEMGAMRRMLREAIHQGAFGMSAGLAYVPGVFARKEELLDFSRELAEQGAIFTVHGRAYVWVSPFYKPMLFGPPHNVRSVNELLGVATESRVRLQLSHQIFIGRRTWWTCPWVLRRIDEARANGVDVALDAFPYTAGNTTVNAIFPEWVLDDFESRIRDRKIIARLRREFAMFRVFLGFDYPDITMLWGATPELSELEGLHFGAIAERLGMSPFDAYIHVAQKSNGKARVLIGTYSGDGEREDPLRAVLSHPMCSFETDTILTSRGKHNPASFGTFPRVLGRYSRELGLFSLEEAVRRMTSLPAERIGLTGVGRVAPGFAADLVIFDAERVGDAGALGIDGGQVSGIDRVLIGGATVVDKGALASARRKGRVLRR